MKLNATRRGFLYGAGAAASAALIGKTIIEPPATLAAGWVRKDIASLSAKDPIILSYRKAVKAMQALPTSNPLSWTYQAAMHYTTLAGSFPAWNGCQHGNYYFWPWHRMYLYWFERIIRKMSGDSTWALPFWNWSAASARQLPAVFRDTSSELYTSHRNAAMNSGAGSLPSGDVSYASAFSLTDFASSSSSLEGSPHGSVHVDVGGWMASVPTAAQDPIFYLHHCNMDRLWNLWLAQGGRHDPTGDTAWRNKSFPFFDENGAAVPMTPCDVLRASQQLNYTYAGEPPQVNQYCLRVFKLFPIWKWIIFYRFPWPPVELSSAPVRTVVDLSALRDKLTAVTRDDSQTLVLKLDNVVAERQPGVVWEVYLGEADSTDSPAFLGNIALFGSGIKSESHMGTFQPASFIFPIRGKLLQSLLQNPKTSLVFVPHGVLIDGKQSRPQAASPVTIGTVSLNVGSEIKQ